MRRFRWIPVAVSAALFLTACSGADTAGTTGQTADNTSATLATTATDGTDNGSDAEDTESNTETTTQGVVTPSYTGDYTYVSAREVTVVHAADAEDSAKTISGTFTITDEDGNEADVEVSGNVYTITEEGTYVISGKLSDGQILVDAGEDAEVELILNGASITSRDSAPICVLSADSVKVKAEADTYNEVIDARDQKDSTTAEEEEDGNAAIYATCDLTIAGKGALVVSGSYNNGIQSTKDLEIKNVTLKVTAVNNALKGNHSVTIDSGEIIAISTGGDAIKTSDSDISSSEKQRGIVSIEGGNIDLYAACDGIDAAYDVNISGEGNLNIYTGTYSDYSGDIVSSDDADFDLIIAQSDYSDSYDYYAYYYNDDESDGTWVKASMDTTVYSGRTAYYGLGISAVSADNVAFFIFEKGADPSTTDYVAASEGDSVNTSKNAYLLSSVTGTIDGDWVSLSKDSGNSQSGKTTYSTKGIKADDAVTISGGTINIYSTDDAIHANSDTILETEEYGVGNVTIYGGTITLTAADDGIHADNELTVNGGYVNVVTAYEGLEGRTITFNAGEVHVYATDDGVNATSGNDRSTTPTVTVNGGYLEVETPSGDTDAVDSNGNYVQTGGYAIIKGGASTGSMAGSVDVDGSVTVSGGTIVAVGGICETPEDSVNAYSSSGTSMAAGDYTLTDSDGNQILAFTLDTSYSSVWIASDQLITDETYTLSLADTSVLNWTQEEGTMGSSGSGWGGFGGGGFGGHGGGMGGHGGW